MAKESQISLFSFFVSFQSFFKKLGLVVDISNLQWPSFIQSIISFFQKTFFSIMEIISNIPQFDIRAQTVFFSVICPSFFFLIIFFLYDKASPIYFFLLLIVPSGLIFEFAYSLSRFIYSPDVSIVNLIFFIVSMILFILFCGGFFEFSDFLDKIFRYIFDISFSEDYDHLIGVFICFFLCLFFLIFGVIFHFLNNFLAGILIFFFFLLSLVYLIRFILQKYYDKDILDKFKVYLVYLALTYFCLSSFKSSINTIISLSTQCSQGYLPILVNNTNVDFLLKNTFECQPCSNTNETICSKICDQN
jgi:hypothetical protein